jgi:hypothetical protein
MIIASVSINLHMYNAFDIELRDTLQKAQVGPQAH